MDCELKKDCHDGIVVNGGSDGLLLSHANSNKLIIDTDLGIDDSMAIFMAFQNPEYEILDATRNALLLVRASHFWRPDVPVAQGSPEPLTGGRPIVADFVHGSDGLGNIFLSPPNLLICRRDSLAILRAELKSQNKQVKNLKKKSLWSRILEEVLVKLYEIFFFVKSFFIYL
ncbi:hypothetical protein ES288_D08G123400v1 [Gossypium darwinii]|uniref:Inosine/uridine-preferring nucleoside hydrolase domain-containing protein n=2 Tax=Gossypium TaxID=3633 RepID=A0A5D2JT31_GOSTO|nr:hypothetical protein ES288_D08G123400v1 [Gossypium darwinii]TYH57931.1 hypothetical protein ES332_D08G121600v1 [Gossypium tomentosum]